MKRFFCVMLSLMLVLSITACSSPKSGSTATDGSVASGVDATSAAGTTQSVVKGIPAEELVVPPITVKELDLTPEGMLQALKNAWAEFDDSSMADDAEYLEILEVDTSERNEKTTFKTGNAFQIEVFVWLDTNSETGETTRRLSSVTVNAVGNIHVSWPRINIYTPVRAFVCEDAADAKMLTEVLVVNDYAPEEEEKFFPLVFGGYYFEFRNEFGKMRPLYITPRNYINTVADGQRMLLPAPQAFDLNEVDHEYVIEHFAELVGSTVMVEMEVELLDDNRVYGRLDEKKYRVTSVYFEDERTLVGLVEGDWVRVMGTLTSAEISGDAAYYYYSIGIRGLEMEKI